MPAQYAKLGDRHPFEVYMLGWAFIATAPSALGLTPLSVTVQETSGPVAGRMWAVGLTVGSLIALIGLAWHRPAKGKLSVTGLVLEQIGLVTVASATIFYSAAAFIRSGTSALPIIGVVLGVGTASAVQAWKVQRVLKALE
jgi:hypothetical protein